MPLEAVLELAWPVWSRYNSTGVLLARILSVRLLTRRAILALHTSCLPLASGSYQGPRPSLLDRALQHDGALGPDSRFFLRGHTMLQRMQQFGLVKAILLDDLSADDQKRTGKGVEFYFGPFFCDFFWPPRPVTCTRCWLHVSPRCGAVHNFSLF